MEINYNNIPMELKTDGLFCVWKLNAELSKIPINPVSGYKASTTDKSTFNNYSTILTYLPEYYVHNANGELTGGLGLGLFNRFSAIDIDNCIDENGVISDMANDIIEYMGSYTEISPSGRGIRIIFKTNIVLKAGDENYYIHNKNNGLEIYISESTNRYVTLTGNKLGDNNINDIDITYILETYMKKNTIGKPKQTISISDVNEKVEQALKVNPKLYELWHKTPDGSGGSENEDDLSLLNILARVFFGDYKAIETAFESSPYFQKKDQKHYDKWMVRQDYKITSIQKAITSFHDYKLDSSNYNFNDTGNGIKFVEMFSGRVRYNVENKVWVIWNGTFWETDNMGRIFGYADMVIETMKMEEAKQSDMETKKKMYANINKALSAHGKKNMLSQAEYLEGIPVTNTSFDINDLTINTKSGIVDLKTGDIIPHNRDLLHSKIINIEVSKKTPTKWIQFLNETYADNPDLVGYIQRLVGYILTGLTSEQALFIFHGDGSNGKSLLLETILKVTGDYGTTTSSDILVQRGYGDKTAELLAPLNNTRFVMVEETESDDRLKEAVIKNLTSDYGNLQGRFMYGNFFSFKPKFKLIMATNYKPQIRGMDHGIWRRIKLIPHNIIIPDSKQDKMLGSKLEKELPEILGWAIDGAIEYLKNGLQEPIIIKQQVADYRSESNVVARWITDNCERDESYSEAVSTLFADFNEWIKSNNEHTMSTKHFGMILTREFGASVRLGGVRSYKGLRIKTEEFMTKYLKAEIKGGD